MKNKCLLILSLLAAGTAYVVYAVARDYDAVHPRNAADGRFQSAGCALIKE